MISSTLLCTLPWFAFVAAPHVSGFAPRSPECCIIVVIIVDIMIKEIPSSSSLSPLCQLHFTSRVCWFCPTTFSSSSMSMNLLCDKMIILNNNLHHHQTHVKNYAVNLVCSGGHLTTWNLHEKGLLRHWWWNLRVK